ncbi:MAG: NAD(P)/FAD-dependent oxidoreductase, partial [Actinobacteria bacterium]|nr:NAD(P)/FAD-dependent oxidoreductase [Actinomycetota bacterium]
MGYDAIIIGSGLGGCAAGAALTGAGRKVLILEQMNEVGGRCSSRKREGFRLDTGPHFLFGCEHGAFEQAASRVGKAGQLKFRHPQNLCLKIVDCRVTITPDVVTVERPGAENITVYTANAVKDAIGVIPERLMKIGLGASAMLIPAVTSMLAPVVSRFDNLTVKEAFDQFVKWQTVRDFVEQFQCAGYGTPSDLTPVSELMRTVLILLEYYKPGMNPLELFGFPIGGLITIPQTICDGITGMGGEVRTGSRVKRVLIEGGKAVGVEVESGDVIRAPVVISNVGIKDTVSRLVGEEHFDPSYAKAVRETIMGISCFVIHAALDTKITDLEGGFSISAPDQESYFNTLWYGRKVPDELPSLMWTVPSNM